MPASRPISRRRCSDLWGRKPTKWDSGRQAGGGQGGNQGARAGDGFDPCSVGLEDGADDPFAGDRHAGAAGIAHQRHALSAAQAFDDSTVAAGLVETEVAEQRLVQTEVAIRN